MAYGGDHVPGKLAELKFADQLKCPICLERYKTPRSLTCLHAFCEGCITSCILEAVEKGSMTSGIQCPLCREVTESPASTKPPTEWARELPLNSAILLQLGVTESESARQCGVCGRKNKQRPAQAFCVECNMFQCTECVDHHSKLPVTENHKLVGVNEGGCYPYFNLGQAENCPEHFNEKLKFFCKDDKQSCCATCAILHHRACKSLSEIHVLGKALKAEFKPQLTRMQIIELENQFDNFIKTLETNLSEGVQQAIDVQNQLKLIRKQIISMLDQIVDRVTSECDQLQKQQKAEVEGTLATIRSQKAAAITSHSLLETLMKHSTDRQIFLSFSKFQRQVKDYQNKMTDLRRSLKTVKIRLCLSEDLKAFVKNTSPIAHVTYHSTLTFPPMAECKMNIACIQRKPGECQPDYRAAHLLPGERLLAIEYKSDCCCFLDDVFSVTDKVQLPSKPTDMAVMSQSEAVVVLPSTNQLQRVSVGTGLTLNGKIQSTIRNPRCVSRVSDTELAVGWEQGLSIVDLDGTEKFYLDKDSSGRQIQFSKYCRMLTDTVSSRLYQSSWRADAVYGMEMTGMSLFTYTNNLKDPAGLALDRDRNLYVCSYDTRSVHQVGPDGQGIRIIDVGFDYPYTVFFDQTGTKMTVMGDTASDDLAVSVMFEPTS